MLHFFASKFTSNSEILSVFSSFAKYSYKKILDNQFMRIKMKNNLSDFNTFLTIILLIKQAEKRINFDILNKDNFAQCNPCPLKNNTFKYL